MSAVANPTIGLRPYLPADAQMLAEIFRASIAELTSDEYSESNDDSEGKRRQLYREQAVKISNPEYCSVAW